MGDETGVERVPRHAADIACLAGAFEAMQQNYVPDRSQRRAMGFDQDLGIGVGTYKATLFRERTEIVPARPEIAQDSQQVWITDDRFEGPHVGEILLSQGTGAVGDGRGKRG
jgi:hypothetical protein